MNAVKPTEIHSVTSSIVLNVIDDSVSYNAMLLNDMSSDEHESDGSDVSLLTRQLLNNLKVLDDQYQQQQPAAAMLQRPRKSRRGRSSQYRGVTFYRRTGRWESHIW